MSFLKNYAKEHFSIIVFALVIYLAGSVTGSFAGATNPVSDMEAYIKSLENLSFGTAFKNGMLTNLMYTAALCISATSSILLPFAVAIIAFKGFAAGYTCSLIMGLSGASGALAGFLIVVLPLSFSFAIHMMMYTETLGKSLAKFKGKQNSIQNYYLKMAVLFLLLGLITFFEALSEPWVINSLM